jgi:4-amino-4-deoxy-L-arabinose transferase-like glycosyltransferase
VAGRRAPRALVGAPLTIAAVTAFGYVVRLVTLLDVAPQRTDSGDPRAYHVGANLLAHARGVPEALNWLNDETIRPTALHGPLYQLLLSISSRFGGTAYIDHKLASLLIGAGVVLAVMLLAREVAGPGVALVAGVLAAVYPNLWILDGIMFPEPLAALLTTLAVLFAYRWRAAPSYRATVVLGVAIALGALARGEGLLLLPLVVAPCVLLAKPLAWPARVRHLVVAGLVFGLVISPWTIRNLRTFEKLVPLSTNSNELLAYSNCDTTYFGPYIGHWDFYCQERIREQQGEFPGDESQTSAAWRDVAIDYARAHKGELPRVATVRVLRQWELYGAVQNIGFGATEGRNRTAAGVALAMYYPLVLLAAVGLVTQRRSGRWNLPLLAPFAGVTFVALYAYGNTRFRAPAEPVLCVLAAIGLATLVAYLRGRRTGARAVAADGAVGAWPAAR